MKNPYEIRGDITAILLRHRDWTIHEALVDTIDLPKMQHYAGTWAPHWCEHTQGYYVEGHEPMSGIHGKTIRLHRWLLDASDGVVVDHINHNGLDNRRCNLRLLTRSENLHNKRLYRNNTSGYRGVTWHKDRKKWAVQVGANGENHYIGLFDSKEEAAEAARRARAVLLPYSIETGVADDCSQYSDGQQMCG